MGHGFIPFRFGFLGKFLYQKYINIDLELVKWVKDKYKMEGIVFLLLFIMMVASMVFLLPFEVGKMINTP